jgi:Zn-dependent M16 (insulinase) family peptidase
MFAEFLSNIGTKNYKYDEFNNKMLSCMSELKVQIDRYSAALEHDDILDRHE